MRKVALPILVTLLVLVAAFGISQVVRGQSPTENTGEQILSQDVSGENMRQISAPAGSDSPEQPNIGFIDSPSSTCYQPDVTKDVCYINWYYVSVNASPNYMVSMDITLNTFGKIAHVNGFFQTSMYVPYNMLGNGFKVACGALGAGGNVDLGNAYAWTINAADSSQLKSANYGTVYCPAFTP